jgi:serine/threonine-protein kinase
MVGRTISHYQILEKLGAGGMGEIYKAHDTRLNRFVAIKALTRVDSGDPDRRERFVREAQAASSLNHPNIITIYDIVSEGGDEFMVMEFVNGKTLGDLLPAGGLGFSTVLAHAIQIADALEAAHAAGIVHRDLKPANIMVTGTGLVKVLDFGLAKLIFRGRGPLGAVSGTDKTESVLAASLTTQGSILGTVSYMSPEQAESKRVDPRSDIFSFGLVLYEMVTGLKAFAYDSAISTLSAILRDEAKPIAAIKADVPPELERLVYRALRKDPDERWQSMKEVHGELVSLRQKLDSGQLMAPVIPVPPPVKKRRGALWAVSVWALAGLVLCALAGGAWWWMTHVRPAPPVAGPVSHAPVVPAPVAPAPAAPRDAALTNQDVLDLAAAKVPAPIIIGHIQSQPNQFDLSTAAIIRLTQAGVPAAVIEAMQHPKGAVAAAVASVPNAPHQAVEKGRAVEVADATPFPIALTEDVPADPQPGQSLHFKAAQDVRMGDAVVIATGAAVTGEVVDASRKRLIGRSKPTFRLLDAVAVDGSRLKIRTTPTRKGEAPPERPLEPIGPGKSKDALLAGSAFLAYLDGAQMVKVAAQ